MKTTLDIAADVLEMAKEKAKEQKISVGKALSIMARRGKDSEIGIVCRDGIYEFDTPEGLPKFGPEEVQAALDAEFEEYAQYFRKPDRKSLWVEVRILVKSSHSF